MEFIAALIFRAAFAAVAFLFAAGLGLVPDSVFDPGQRYIVAAWQYVPGFVEFSDVWILAFAAVKDACAVLGVPWRRWRE